MNAKELGRQPAFPDSSARVDTFGFESSTSLSKRELLAAMAMQGLYSDGATNQVDARTVAIDAVQMADALLAELVKDQS